MPDQPAGHDYRIPVPPEIVKNNQEIGRLIGSQLPPGWGFALLVFTFGGGGTMTYISNAQRADMVKAMQEFIAKQANA